MDKLTAIKIKYDDGTYSDEIPVGVLSENVEWDSTHTLVDVLGSIDIDVTGTIQDQISQLFNEKVSSSELNNYISNQLNTDVTNWLSSNVYIPTGGVVTLDKTLTQENSAADSKIVGNKIKNLEINLNENGNSIKKALYTNLLIGYSLTEQWFVDPSTGVGRTLSTFDSFLNVEIPENITILYPYDIAYTSGGNSIRAISFYDVNNNFISGINGNVSAVLNGITIPSGAKTLSATLVKGEFPRNFYLSTIQGNPITLPISAVNGLSDMVDEVNDLQATKDDLLEITHADLLYGVEKKDKWFVDNSTGVGRTLNDFCSFINVPIPDGIAILYPYNNF